MRQQERVARQLEAAIAKGAARAAQADAASVRSQRMLAAQHASGGARLAGGAIVHSSVFEALEMNDVPPPPPAVMGGAAGAAAAHKAASKAAGAPPSNVPRVMRAAAMAKRGQ